MSEFMGSCVTYSIITKDNKIYRVVRDPLNILGHFDAGEIFDTRLGEFSKDVLDSGTVRDLMINLFNCIEDEYLTEIGEEQSEDGAQDNYACLEEEDPEQYEAFEAFIEKVSDEVTDIDEISEIHMQEIIRCEAAEDNINFRELISVAFDIPDDDECEAIADEIYEDEDSEYRERFKQMLTPTSKFEKISEDVPYGLDPFNFRVASVEKVLVCATGEIKTFIDYLGGDGLSKIQPLAKKVFDPNVCIFKNAWE